MTPVPTQQDFDRLVDTIYAAAFEHAWQPFRGLALQQLCEWSGARSAEWLTHVGNEWPAQYAAWPADAATGAEALHALRIAAGEREQVLEILPATLTERGASAGGHGFVLQLAHRGTHLHSLVLLRFAAGVVPEREILRRAVGHLVQAGTLALRRFIQRDEDLQTMGRPSRGSTALIDERGYLYVSSQRFLSMVSEQYGEHDFVRLPFPLPAEALDQGQGMFFTGGLHFRLHREGDLYLLHVRRPHPLDVLSPREQQIARALSSGKTFKSVAREYSIALSTVANHASRIYRKLGVYRREELVGLLRAAAVKKSA